MSIAIHQTHPASLLAIVVATTNTLFSCVLMHVIIAATMLLAGCAKKTKAKQSKEEEQPTEPDDRQTGGGNEHSHHHRHFTPPHIATAAPGPSALRPHAPPPTPRRCPVHCQFSESRTEDSDETSSSFVDSANTSDIEFDSTQSLSGVDHQQYLAAQCTCFCAAPKRVRFQCPTTSSLSLRRFI